MLPLSKSWFARWTWASQPWLFTEQEQTSASRTWWNSRVCSNHPSAGNCNVSHSRVLYCSHCLSLGATHTLLLRYACTDAFIYLFIYFCATTVANKSLPLFSSLPVPAPGSLTDQAAFPAKPLRHPPCKLSGPSKIQKSRHRTQSWRTTVKD